MFDKPYEEQLLVWSSFRDTLETSDNPFEDVIEFYSKAPHVSLATDPWDSSRWPTAWELLEENQYCDFCRVLGYCFSLQLTDRFNGSNFEIHINTHDEKGYVYLLVVDKSTVLSSEEVVMSYAQFKEKYQSQLVYDMTNLT